MSLRGLLGLAPNGRLAILDALLAGDSSLEELVGVSALPRRDVEEFLAALDGRDWEKPFASYQASRAVVRLEDEAELERFAAALIADAPAPRKRFDHVPATPGTLVRRVRWLTERFDLSGRSVLFAGDHDLTSLLLARVVPDALLTVADIDEDLLAYLDSASGGRVRCVWADFRFGLPPALAESADVVFTDPPYAPEGLGLFLSRSVAALRRGEADARIVVAYGHSRRRPDLGLAAQREILRHELAIDAMLPAFNGYAGAQAVGSASDLYCLQPSPAAFRRAGAAPADRQGIYTHGEQSVESGTAPAANLLPSAVPASLDPVSLGLVFSGHAPAGDFAVTVGLAKLLADGVHPSVTARAEEFVVDLRDDPGPWLLRAMLALNAGHATFVVPRRHEAMSRLTAGAAEWDLVRAKYASISSAEADGVIALRCDLAADDPGLALARFVTRRAHGKLRNVWREGLIAVSAASGTPLTKRAAADLADEFAGDRAADLSLRLIDIPAAHFPDLHAALRASATN